MEILAAVLFLVGVNCMIFDADLAYVMCWVLCCLSTCIFCFRAYAKSKHFEIKKRIVMILCIVYSILFASNITTIYFNSRLHGDMLTVLGLCALVYFMVRTVVLSYVEGECYKVRGTYLAFKRPKNLQGYVAALFKTYGSVILVIDSQEFKFRHGKLVEREHVISTSLTYKKICNVPLADAREYLGTQWKWYRNCFSVLGGIANRANRRDSKTGTRKRGFYVSSK